MSADPRIQVVRAVTRIQAEFIHRIFTKPNQRVVSQVFPPFHRHHHLSTSKVTMHHLFRSENRRYCIFLSLHELFSFHKSGAIYHSFRSPWKYFSKTACHTLTFQKCGINTYFTRALAAIQNSRLLLLTSFTQTFKMLLGEECVLITDIWAYLYRRIPQTHRTVHNLLSVCGGGGGGNCNK
jgi:hypothetical protein